MHDQCGPCRSCVGNGWKLHSGYLSELWYVTEGEAAEIVGELRSAEVGFQKRPLQSPKFTRTLHHQGEGTKKETARHNNKLKASQTAFMFPQPKTGCSHATDPMQHALISIKHACSCQVSMQPHKGWGGVR